MKKKHFSTFLYSLVSGQRIFIYQFNISQQKISDDAARRVATDKVAWRKPQETPVRKHAQLKRYYRWNVQPVQLGVYRRSPALLVRERIRPVRLSYRTER